MTGVPSERPRVGARESAVAFGIALAWAMLVRAGPLSLPYFWDEGDVYAAGARWLALHGLDLRPGHFPDDWSRGHPQLFYLYVALAFRIFGTAPVVGHAAMLPFTALALAGTYVLATERAGREAGAAAAALLGATPLFMAIGAQVLPEMPLTALTVVALVLFARGRLVGAAIVGVALVWIKETGVFTPLAITAAVVVSPGRTWREALISASPVLALIAFFVWQRATAGYFVFPHHVGLLTARPFVPLDVLTVFPSLFSWHGRWVATLGALSALAVSSFRRKGERARIPDRTTLAIGFLVVGNAIFFAKMFWLERYALPVHPGICVLCASWLAAAAARLPRRAAIVTMWPMVLAAALGVLWLHRLARGAPEQTFGYADVIASHRAAIARVEAVPGDPLVVTTWPLTTELQEPWLGFAHRPTRAVHPDYLEVHPTTRPDVVLVDHASSHAAELRALASRLGLVRRTTVEVGHASRIEVWTR